MRDLKKYGSSALRDPACAMATVVTAVGCLAWLIAMPHVADLAAQYSRTQFLRDGATTYSTSWFGGTALPNYSLVAPWLMDVFTPEAIAIVATLASAVAGGLLLRKAPRSRPAAVVLALSLLGNLLSGRITFAIGLAFAMWALVGATHGRHGDRKARWLIVASCASAALSSAGSPVAGVLLLIALAAWVLAGPGRADLKTNIAVGASAAVPLGMMAVLFPGAGYQPFTFATASTAFLISLIVAVAPGSRSVRVGALVSMVAIVGCYFIHSALGSNVVRITLLFSAVALVATARLRPKFLAVAMVPGLLWPVFQVSGDISVSNDASSSAAYYSDLITQLKALPDVSLHRVEVVEPRTHRQAYYLLGAASIARGWNRQLDRAANPILYTTKTIQPDAYRQWLDSLAVAYVAVPDAPKDFGSQSEAALLETPPAYLEPVWNGVHWKLYRVVSPMPLASGVARVVAQRPAGLDLAVDRPGEAFLRLRWSRGLELRGVAGCLRPAGEWTQAIFREAGRATITGTWNGLFAQTCPE